MPVLVLQALAVQRRPACGGPEQEAPGLRIARRPGQVADALEAEHGVENIERHQGVAVRAVRGRRRQPRGEGARLVDALLEDLAVLGLPVRRDLAEVLRLVELALGGVDAELAEHAFHAERAGLVRDDRHDAVADALVARKGREDAHESHRRRHGPFSGAGELLLEDVERRHRHVGRGTDAFRDRPTELLALALEVDGLGRVRRGSVVGDLGKFVVRDRQVEAVPEVLEFLEIELLDLMGRVLRFARVAHAVSLDGLGEDDGRLSLVMHGGVIGRVDLERIVAAPVQMHDVVVGQVGDQRLEFRVLAEEVLPRVGTALGLVVLVFAVDHLIHAALQQAVSVVGEERVPEAAPDHLDDVPAGTAEHALEFLDDLAVAAHRAVEALQVAVDHEDQVVELLAPREPKTAEGFGLVAFPIAQEGPHLAVPHRNLRAAVQVLHDVGLVDRLDRPQAHGDGRKLPIVRHQPWMRIRRQATVHLASEGVQIGFVQPALEIRARVDPRRTVTLEIDEIPRLLVRRRPKEMVEADVVEGRGGRER